MTLYRLLRAIIDAQIAVLYFLFPESSRQHRQKAINDLQRSLTRSGTANDGDGRNETRNGDNR